MSILANPVCHNVEASCPFSIAVSQDVNFCFELVKNDEHFNFLTDDL
jgi:hypothetical protein